MKPINLKNTDSNGASARSCGRAAFPLLVLLLASCANPPPADQAGTGEECVYVRVTGSNLPVKECRTAAEREAIAATEREASEQGLRDLRQLEEYDGKAPGGDSIP
jgi:hypothetical protein